MPTNEPHLPFFVYGSLLPGQLYAHLWGDGIARQQPAWLPHGRLYDAGPYPIVCDNEPGRVYGLLTIVKEAAYTAVRQRLDALEGYFPDQLQASDYWRVARQVQLEDGMAVEAWIYVAPPHFQAQLPWVQSGDWVAHLQQRTATAKSKKIS